MKQNALRAKDAQLKVNLPIGQREDALGHAERKLLLRSPGADPAKRGHLRAEIAQSAIFFSKSPVDKIGFDAIINSYMRTRRRDE